MKLAILALGMALAAAGCSLRRINQASLMIATATIACDWAQTRSVAEDGWGSRFEENPILGPSPSTEEVDAYFGAVVVAHFLVWRRIPSSFRWVLPVAISAVQIMAIVDNHTLTGSCLK